ncbi:hypothetical protein PUN28_013978 [Cardiocondyla obscurior]|uniref:Uncharacterized protein n=1 Tax=Cardiocondyla obscurior TaxID=286306 RepID=A0AAW2F825_9HYME
MTRQHHGSREAQDPSGRGVSTWTGADSLDTPDNSTAASAEAVAHSPPTLGALSTEVATTAVLTGRPRSPCTPRPLPVTQGTQTEEPILPAIQHEPQLINAETQTDPWATTLASDSEPVQYPGDERWGPIRVTLTAPHIFYRERRI